MGVALCLKYGCQNRPPTYDHDIYLVVKKQSSLLPLGEIWDKIVPLQLAGIISC